MGNNAGGGCAVTWLLSDEVLSKDDEDTERVLKELVEPEEEVGDIVITTDVIIVGDSVELSKV